MRPICKSVLAAAVFSFAYAKASAGVLGVAGNYNAFVFGELQEIGGSSGGAIASGDDTYLQGFNVATSLSTGDNLVTRDDLYLSSSVVNGNVIVAGIPEYPDGPLDGGDTTIYGGGVTGDVTTLADYYGDSGPTNGGTVYYGGYYGGPDNINHQQISSVTLPFDFDTVEGQLLQTSDSLAQLSPTGSYTDDSSGNLVFTGTDTGQNVFTIDTNDLDSATAITIDIPASATAVINVVYSYGSSGGFASLPSATFNFNSSQVLWNFDDFSTVLFNSFSGSILAPTADVTQGPGDYQGTIVANQLSGQDDQLTLLSPGNTGVSVVPLPEGLWAGLVLLGVLGISRRKAYH